jgi:hypothetical protein
LVDSTAIQTDGAIVGSFSDYDGLVEGLRERASAVGLSFAMIDDLAGLAEAGTAKYLGLQTFLSITEALAIRAIFVEDEKMLRRMKPMWGRRDGKKAHALPLGMGLGMGTASDKWSQPGRGSMAVKHPAPPVHATRMQHAI